ncbi:MAG: hypothetical protein Kow0013_15800 [Pararhodobacter sp.]
MSDSLSFLTPEGTVRSLPDEGRFPAVAAVQRHWEALRGSRVAPARTEIDPRPLAQCLEVMFVAELVAPHVARLRLCGQHLNDLLGMEPRGMPLGVFFRPEARSELDIALEQVAQGARVTLPLRAQGGFGRPALEAMLALMPLTDADGRMSRVLGVLESEGQIGRAPRRFGLGAPARATVPARPLPEARTPSTLTPSARTPSTRRPGRPVLHVIEGGRR